VTKATVIKLHLLKKNSTIYRGLGVLGFRIVFDGI